MRKLFGGIDPGRTGAMAVVDDDGAIIALHSWTTRQRKRRKVLLVNDEHICMTSACLGRWLARHVAPDHIVCESQYVSKNARTGLVLSRTAGMTVSELLASAVEGGTAPEDVVKFMLPSEWRRVLFGNVGKLDRDGWKALAVAYTFERYGQTFSVDEAEAICMALVCAEAQR